jgi:predicted dehydrogenase
MEKGAAMTIKVAISGAGFIAGVHARAVKNSDEAVVDAVVEFDPQKGRAFAADHGIKRVYQSVNELLKDGGADALVIGVPNALHAPQAIAALSAHIPVLVEKPMAMNAAEAASMLETGQRNNTVLMVAHCWRFDEEARWLRGQVETGLLGNILRTKGYGVHSNWGPEGWFKQKALAGGGALVDMGIHALDTARYLLGDPEPESVFAKIGTNYIEADVDDTGVVIVTWKNGAVTYLEAGWWQPHMDGPEAATQLYGQKGFGSLFPTLLEIPNTEEMRVDTIDPGYAFPREDHAPQEMYDRQMAYFLECVKSGKTPIPGALEGWINMRILVAAYQSAREGNVVYL